VREASNAILIGPNGVGKTTIARNIAYQAVLAGYTVLCTSAGHMLNELAGADGDHALRHRLALYARPRLLLIDEIGYLSYSNRHADLLFEIVSRRYQEKSTLVTTNRPFAEWGELFPNAACVVSLVDRLVHHAEIISIEGESYRLKSMASSGAVNAPRARPPHPAPLTEPRCWRSTCIPHPPSRTIGPPSKPWPSATSSKPCSKVSATSTKSHSAPTTAPSRLPSSSMTPNSR
jgi:hypothetical protein